MNSLKRNLLILLIVFILVVVVMIGMRLLIQDFKSNIDNTTVMTLGTTAFTTLGTQPTDPQQGGSETTAPTVTPTTPTTAPETVPVTTAPAVGTEPAPTEPIAPTAPDETTVPQETKHEHSYTEKRKEPTCTRDGVITGTCACGKKYTDYIDALGHDWSEWVITKEPTTESTGDRERSCGRCGLTEKDFVAPLDKETGEEYTSYIDPKLTVEYINGTVWYRYKEMSVGVLDTRTWGEAPSIYVEEGGSLRVIYFQKSGERVELLHSPVADKFHRGVIMEDGTFATVLVGDFG